MLLVAIYLIKKKSEIKKFFKNLILKRVEKKRNFEVKFIKLLWVFFFF